MRLSKVFFVFYAKVYPKRFYQQNFVSN